MTTTSVSLVKYKFYLVMSIKIICMNGGYTYKITDIFFVPESGFFRTMGYYQNSPDYLIDLYKKKHIGFTAGVNMGRKKIREYLKNTDGAIRACITSLNQAMAGK